MTIEVLKSKIHRVTVTGAELDYVGSITIDPVLMDAADLIAGEKVNVVNVNNGERIETYIIEGVKNSGEITLNGPAARKAQKGDIVIIISYAQLTVEEAKNFVPKIIFPNPLSGSLDPNQLIIFSGDSVRFCLSKKYFSFTRISSKHASVDFWISAWSTFSVHSIGWATLLV